MIKKIEPKSMSFGQIRKTKVTAHITNETPIDETMSSVFDELYYENENAEIDKLSFKEAQKLFNSIMELTFGSSEDSEKN